MIIAVDFDGTCVTHEFPKIGKDIGAEKVLKQLVRNGHKLILYTMRSHDDRGNTFTRDVLQDAINWFKQRDIPLYGVNENPDQHTWTTSPKPYAHIYIDDAALGVPLKFDELSNKSYVNWELVEEFLKNMKII